MSYNKDDYIRIKAEFSKKYLLAQQRAQANRMELYAAIPAVRELDGVLNRTGMDIMGVIAKGGNTEEALSAIRRRNEELLAERAKLLREGGYPEDYSDIHYDCPLCGDSGFVDTKMCNCMRRALIEAGYESSGLGALIRTQSFDNFSAEYYRNDSKAYECMGKAAANLRAFAEHFDGKTYRNYLLMGGTGLGKTHLSTAVAKIVIEGGFDVLYVTAVGMLSDFEAKRFGRAEDIKHDIDRYTETELLIIDDLGTEVTNQFTLSCLYDVINSRINRRLCTIINTNLSAKELETRYNERITSRLMGEYQPIIFTGEDIRRQKLRKS